MSASAVPHCGYMAQGRRNPEGNVPFLKPSGLMRGDMKKAMAMLREYVSSKSCCWSRALFFRSSSFPAHHRGRRLLQHQSTSAFSPPTVIFLHSPHHQHIITITTVVIILTINAINIISRIIITISVLMIININIG